MSATNRGAERHPNDFYGTPKWLTRAMVDPLMLMGPVKHKILEPACGELAMVDVLKENWPNSTIDHFDINPPWSTDFLKEPPRQEYDMIITNPPYSLAMEFIETAMRWRKDHKSLVVMLLRLNFLGSRKRAKWLRANTPSIYVTPRRPSMGLNKHGKPGTDATEYAFFVWSAEKPTISILNTEDSKSQKYSDILKPKTDSSQLTW